jgi:uncharacterized protein
MSNGTGIRIAAALGALMLATIVGLAQTEVPAAFFQAGKIRTLILSGRNNHDWRTTTPQLRALLASSGRFDVRVNEEPVGLTSDALAPYDLVVLDYCGPRWGEGPERAVEAFIRGGKGLVVVHGASYTFSGLEVLADGHKPTGIREQPWPEYSRMVGAYWPAPPPKGFHGKHHAFTVKVSGLDHPITRGMPDSFAATDELYHDIKVLPGTRILATAFDDPAVGGTGRDEPILCAVEYEQGRVFYTALGHEVPAMRAPGFISSFVRGAEWAGTGKVTLPPDAGQPRTGN